MAGSVNKAMMIGRLGRDPEVRTTNGGNRVVTFSLATSETWRDKATGERKERTEWHNVVIFNDALGKIAEQYLKKGSPVYLEGKVRTRQYEDRDGQPRKTTEIVIEQFSGELTLLGGGERPAPSPDSYGTTRVREPAQEQRQARPTLNEIDDPRQTMGRADSFGRSAASAIDDDIPF